MWFLNNFANHCGTRSFFGIDSWDKYLVAAGEIKHEVIENSNGQVIEQVCQFTGFFDSNGEFDFGVFTLAGLGILDILLRLGALVAVGFVVYGGIQYVISQGEPEKTKNAMKTITNALVGLAITVFAAVIVAFIGNTVG